MEIGVRIPVVSTEVSEVRGKVTTHAPLTYTQTVGVGQEKGWISGGREEEVPLQWRYITCSIGSPSACVNPVRLSSTHTCLLHFPTSTAIVNRPFTHAGSPSFVLSQTAEDGEIEIQVLVGTFCPRIRDGVVVGNLGGDERNKEDICGSGIDGGDDIE
nr:unnamed protein product [Timema tahoe]